jgi:hypothetical protein
LTAKRFSIGSSKPAGQMMKITIPFLLSWLARPLNSLKVSEFSDRSIHTKLTALSIVLTHMVNLLLDDANVSTYLADLVDSAGAKDDSVLQGYISEVFRTCDWLILFWFSMGRGD